MKRDAILHIGPMKTGSTSIQVWLRGNRNALSTLGIHVPRKPGAANMSKVAKVAYARAHDRAIEDPEVVERWKLLSEEFSELPESARSVVISGEIMGQKLRQPSEVAALKTMLDPWFDRYRIIVYLRRQDEISVSLYTTHVRQRAVPDSALLSNPVDYAAMLDAWASLFGREALTPRLFDRADLVGGDIIADFAHTLGIPAGSVPLEAKVKNQSLKPEAQTFLSQLYDRAPEGQRNRYLFDPDNFALMNRAVRTFTGPGRLPARDEAIAFAGQIEESNERVRREWFPTRARLFSDDFSRYPPEGSGRAPAEEVLKVALAVAATLLVGTNPKAWDTLDDDEDDDEVRARHRSRARAEAAATSELPRAERRTRRERRLAAAAAEAGADRGQEADARQQGGKIEDRIVRAAARALWRLEHEAELEGVAVAERNARWSAARQPYLGRARTLLLTLQHGGLQFSRRTAPAPQRKARIRHEA